jgi:ribulose-5-phosphate 4-epimerase/fuculose-1-phosphate aldolase
VGTRDVGAFREAGRTLFSLGLVKAAEGNLSVFDGETLTITRTGSRLADLGEDDVLNGTLASPPAGSSSDLEVHVEWYRERGPGAIAHAHPPGTVPEGAPESGEHGAYAFAATLEDAVRHIIEEARSR